MTQTRRCLNCITPPYILKRLLDSGDDDVRRAALNTLLSTAQLRGKRIVRAGFAGAAAAPANGRRTIFDCRNSEFLQDAVLARSESDPPVADESVNHAFDHVGTARDFFKKVLGRNSIDNRGMRLQAYVHFGVDFNNAFWDGEHLVFGDGDGIIFSGFTDSRGVVVHEFTHGVTEHTANLEYHKQSGALNESISDVFGAMADQWVMKQTADQADWLIGAEIFTPGIGADALRSMKAPGTAFDNDLLGKDPQPDHMKNFVVLPDTEEGDNGGVHFNSGIPNKAFYLTAVGIGGFSWEAPGRIWYESLKASNPQTNFQEFADTTFSKAGELFGAASSEQQAVREAWGEVGIRIRVGQRGTEARRKRVSAGKANGLVLDGVTIPSLARQIEALSAQVDALAEGVNVLTPRR